MGAFQVACPGCLPCESMKLPDQLCSEIMIGHEVKPDMWSTMMELLQNRNLKTANGIEQTFQNFCEVTLLHRLSGTFAPP